MSVPRHLDDRIDRIARVRARDVLQLTFSEDRPTARCRSQVNSDNDLAPAHVDVTGGCEREFANAIMVVPLRVSNPATE